MQTDPSTLPIPGPVDHAKRFGAMQDRIERNSADFAGAMVIVSPSGKVIEIMLLSEGRNEAAFWAQIKGQIEIAIAEQQEREQRQNPFGRR